MHANTIYNEKRAIAAFAVAILMIVAAAAAISSLSSDADAAGSYTVTVETKGISGIEKHDYTVADGLEVKMLDNGKLQVGIYRISEPELPDPTDEFVYKFDGWYCGEDKVTTVGFEVHENLKITGEVIEVTKKYSVSVASNSSDFGSVMWYDSDDTPIVGSTIEASYGSAIYTDKNVLYVNDYKADDLYYAVATPVEGIVGDYFYAFGSWNLGEEVTSVEEALTVTATFEEKSTIIPYEGVNYKLQNLDGIVTAIGFYEDDEVESIVIPDNFYYEDYDITCTPISIANGALIGCNYNAVEIGANVAEIGYRALAADSFMSITVSESNANFASVDGVLYDKEITTLIQFPLSMRLLYIPETVTEIAAGAFQDAGAALKEEQKDIVDVSYFRYVKLPASVAVIGDYAFAGSTLECLKFSGGSIESIGEYAFSCACLTYVVFNVDIESAEIAENAFDGCVFHDENGSPMSVENFMAGYKFTGDDSSSLNIYVPPVKGTFASSGVKYRITSNDEDSKTVAAACFAKDEVADLVIPESITYLGFKWTVTSIASQAFAGTSVKSVTTSANIGSNAFKGCKSLTSVTIGEATTIGSYAFFGCTALETVNLEGVTSIGTSAFSGCSSLSNIDLRGVATIGKHAFYCCKSLTSADLTSAVSIGYGAFSGTNLQQVSFGNGLTDVDSNAFYGYTFKDTGGTKIKATVDNLKGCTFSGEGKVLIEQA